MSVYVSFGASSMGPGTGAHQLAAHSGSGPAPPRKRKHREDDEADAQASFSTCSSSSLLGLPRPPYTRPRPAEQRPRKQLRSPHPAPVPGVAKQPAGPAPAPTRAKPGGNRLLMAGYLAHEFLSLGTLFGRPYGTTATNVVATTRKEEMQQKRYEEVARILWGGGVHVPGVINPTQLGGWLQKQQDN